MDNQGLLSYKIKCNKKVNDNTIGKTHNCSVMGLCLFVEV